MASVDVSIACSKQFASENKHTPANTLVMSSTRMPASGRFEEGAATGPEDAAVARVRHGRRIQL